MLRIFFLYPDVVFGKGGYAASRRFCGETLPHPGSNSRKRSDPGRVNLWAGSSPQKIAVSYPEAGKSFPAKIRQPLPAIRSAKRRSCRPAKARYEFLKFKHEMPVIFVTAARKARKRSTKRNYLPALPQLIEKYQMIHQTGAANFEDVRRPRARRARRLRSISSATGR